MQVGPRATKDRERFPPNNILLMLAGAGLLWMGWTGFNGGDPYTVSTDASLAVLNTHVCTAASLLTWLILDMVFFGKPSVIGATQGMITAWFGLYHPSCSYFTFVLYIWIPYAIFFFTFY